MKLNPLLVLAGLAITLITTQALAAEPETVYLSSLDLSPIVQGWGQPQADKAVTGKRMSIGSKTFERGLGTHTDSLIRVQLKGGSEKFMTSVGVDDAATSDHAAITFRVIGDGKTLWKSPGMKRGQAARKVEVDVKGVKTLLLLADSGGDVSFGHADWADAKFLVTGERPAIVGSPHEDAVILTPKPARTPRINGARIFGVHPGHPLLFTIPATGDRPMKFAVDHLPKGLSVDAQTGQIHGRLDQPGEYVVTFRAANQFGKAKRAFKIVCGETLALTPHMGWNSWYVWENHVTDQIMRAAADAMVSSGMMDHGYQYVNIDDCWSVKPGASDPTLGGEARDAATEKPWTDTQQNGGGQAHRDCAGQPRAEQCVAGEPDRKHQQCRQPDRVMVPDRDVGQSTLKPARRSDHIDRLVPIDDREREGVGTQRQGGGDAEQRCQRPGGGGRTRPSTRLARGGGGRHCGSCGRHLHSPTAPAGQPQLARRRVPEQKYDDG